MAVSRGKISTIKITGQDLAPKEIKFDDPRVTARIVKTEALTRRVMKRRRAAISRWRPS